MTLGGTVEELKQRMSYAEALQWFAYRRKHGGIGEARTAYLLACLNVMTNNAAGGTATLHDFMPGLPQPQKEELDDGEILMRLWNGTI